VRLGIIADIHGNDVALRAVLKDAAPFGVGRWWALGDLVLFGPRPAEVLELLHGLDGIGMLRGNTDRYVLTGEQPAPHSTAADAAASIDLVERGHTHVPTDRLLDGIRALNPGSAGLPRACGTASWLLLEDDGDAMAVTFRSVPFDVDAVVSDLRRRRHPNADFVTSVLTGQGQQTRAPSSR